VLNIEDVHLGRSKRMIVRSGVLGREFQITVPKDMAKNADGAGADFT